MNAKKFQTYIWKYPSFYSNFLAQILPQNLPQKKPFFHPQISPQKSPQKTAQILIKKHPLKIQLSPLKNLPKTTPHGKSRAS